MNEDESPSALQAYIYGEGNSVATRSVLHGRLEATLAESRELLCDWNATRFVDHYDGPPVVKGVIRILSWPW